LTLLTRAERLRHALSQAERYLTWN